MPSRSRSACDSPVCQRCPEPVQGLDQSPSVLGVARDEQVEIAGGSRNAVDRQRVRSDHEESDRCLLELAQEVAKIVVEDRFAQPEALDRTTLPGMAERS